MLKQTLAATRIPCIRGVVPLAAPRGLNLEIGTVNSGQDNGTSARTAFVAPFHAGTQEDRGQKDRGQEDRGQADRGQEDRGQAENRIRPTAGGALAPPPQGGVRLPARLVRQGAVRNAHTQLCVWGEEGTVDIFWERLSYLFRDSTIGSHVVKVVRVQQVAKNRTRFDLWVPEPFVDATLGKMGPGRARYGWYFRRHIPFLTRVGRGLPQPPAEPPPPAVQMPHPNPMRGAPLVVGTLNINGLHRKTIYLSCTKRIPNLHEESYVPQFFRTPKLMCFFKIHDKTVDVDSSTLMNVCTLELIHTSLPLQT
jgi:hypothetical protein